MTGHYAYKRREIGREQIAPGLTRIIRADWALEWHDMPPRDGAPIGADKSDRPVYQRVPIPHTVNGGTVRYRTLSGTPCTAPAESHDRRLVNVLAVLRPSGDKASYDVRYECRCGKLARQSVGVWRAGSTRGCGYCRGSSAWKERATYTQSAPGRKGID